MLPQDIAQKLQLDKRVDLPRVEPDHYYALKLPVPQGDPSQITPEHVKAHYAQLQNGLAKDLPESERNAIHRAALILGNQKSKAEYDKTYPSVKMLDASLNDNIKPLLSPAPLPATTHESAPHEEKAPPALKAAADRLRESAGRFSIRDPKVMMGAAVLAVGSALLGLRATRNITTSRDEGTAPNAGDKAQQTLGFSAAAGIISTAALMWGMAGKAR